MASKRFCDGCDRLMADGMDYYELAPTLKRHGKGAKPKLLVRVDDGGDWDICKYCILDAFAALDDRPKDVPDRKAQAA